MTPPVRRNDNGPLPLLPVSLILHAAIYGLFFWLHLLPSATFTSAPVYYVDVVNLPVESPQHGSPAATGNESAPAPVPPRPAPPEMKLPSKDAGKTRSAVKPAAPAASSTETSGDSKDFEDRIARLERASEARHEAAAMEALRKRVAAGKGQAGMPGGTGTEAGSDYASYIRSRLVDAFKTTIAYQEKSPRAVVVLTIDRNGKVIRRRTESSTGDRLFEDSVNRAIVKAEKEFRPPPGGGAFEYGFIFTPQGVGRN